MKKIIMPLVCVMLISPGARSQAPDSARTPEAKRLVDEYIKAGGKNIEDVNDMLEEPYGDYTPMLRLADKNDALSIPLIIYTLRKYDDATVKKDCIEALVKLKDKRAEPALRELLDYKDWDVRLSAANALRNFNKNDTQALQALKTIFFECPDEHVRAGSLAGISDAELHKVQYLLKAALEDKSEHVRIMAAALIGGTFDKNGRLHPRKEGTLRDMGVTLLIHWLKNASPQKERQRADYVLFYFLSELLDYSYDNMMVLKELEQIPNEFKSETYKVLINKLKFKK